MLGWSSCVTVGARCEPTVVTKVSSDLNHNDNHSNVTVKADKKCVIDNNVKRNRFVYNSGVNPTCIEALMAKHSPRGRAAKCTIPMVYDRSFVASGSDVLCSEIYNAWRRQSDFNFGFVSLGDQMLPRIVTVNEAKGKSPIQIHEIVRSTSKPNFMQARIQIDSQLNVEAWKKYLEGYWDQQLCELIQFGFPLDFNRSCILNHELGNHKSAVDFSADIEAYIKEEFKYGALLGPFPRHPISAGHCSPFMTRAKPNSDRRRVIVDLSWPPGASVNASIDKTSYLDSVFC